MQNKLVVLVVSFIITALIGTVDYFTGPEISLSVFYLIPVVLITSRIGKNSGLVFAFLCSVILLTIDIKTNEYSNPYFYFWNAFIRFSSFVIVVLLLARVRAALLRERVLSETDHLTGAKNTRGFFKLAETELKKAAKYKYPVTLLYLDFDNFKLINDEHGHQTGDNLIKSASMGILNSIRGTDVLARVGGDEFVILLPETDYEETNTVINRLRQVILNSSKTYNIQLSCSIGSVTYKNVPEDVEILIREADELMYKSKREGKNRVSKELVE